MNLTLFISAIVQILTFSVTSTIILYSLYIISTKILRKKYIFKQESYEATLVLSCGILLSTGCFLTATILPIQNLIRVVHNDIIESIKYIIYFMLLGASISFCLTNIILYFFSRLIKNHHDLSKSSIYVAILSSVLMFIVSLTVRDSYSMMLESIIPYPKIPNYF